MKVLFILSCLLTAVWTLITSEQMNIIFTQMIADEDDADEFKNELIPELQILFQTEYLQKFNVNKFLGHGGFSTIYEAQMDLIGEQDFPMLDVALVIDKEYNPDIIDQLTEYVNLKTWFRPEIIEEGTTKVYKIPYYENQVKTNNFTEQNLPYFAEIYEMAEVKIVNSKGNNEIFMVYVMQLGGKALDNQLTLVDNQIVSPTIEFIQAMIKISFAISKLHEMGFMHGDLKPDNLLQVENENPGNWSPLIADFDYLNSFDNIKNNQPFTIDLLNDSGKKIERYQNYVNDEYAFVTWIGGEEPKWMRVMMPELVEDKFSHLQLKSEYFDDDTNLNDLNLGLEDSLKVSDSYLKKNKYIIPISSKFYKEAGIMIILINELLLINDSILDNEEPLLKQFKQIITDYLQEVLKNEQVNREDNSKTLTWQTTSSEIFNKLKVTFDFKIENQTDKFDSSLLNLGNIYQQKNKRPVEDEEHDDDEITHEDNHSDQSKKQKINDNNPQGRLLVV